MGLPAACARVMPCSADCVWRHPAQHEGTHDGHLLHHPRGQLLRTHYTGQGAGRVKHCGGLKGFSIHWGIEGVSGGQTADGDHDDVATPV